MLEEVTRRLQMTCLLINSKFARCIASFPADTPEECERGSVAASRFFRMVRLHPEYRPEERRCVFDLSWRAAE